MAASPPLLAGLARLSSTLALARDWSAPVHTIILASGSLLLPWTVAAAGPVLAGEPCAQPRRPYCLQEGGLWKRNQSGWAAPASQTK